MTGRLAVVGALTVVAVGLLSACSEEKGAPVPVTTVVIPSPSAPSGVDRSRRIQQRLLELGCSTNSCIQTYFACMDGYLTGDPCEFYRLHPPE
ncbi:hypothetical protein [Nocardia bovistercoris]|uniref:Lipoprotein n=1 Tax=Nocardia bovistercoris TaxID=2785916 RepID=A0A931ICZ6_9NOCA|nr:hypothetical protein [Nocardia bovistercoris]MBH0778125.1 hypothetical protein [Nocardia bovistercoris]